jgi:hypothetical protein
MTFDKMLLSKSDRQTENIVRLGHAGEENNWVAPAQFLRALVYD